MQKHCKCPLLVFTVIYDSTTCLCLLRLLLLAELFVHSSSRPAHSSSLCGLLGSMIPQVDMLMSNAKKLHELSENELSNLAATESRLHGLPNLQHTAAHFNSLKVNESLSQLYEFIQSIKLHVDWLKTAKDNFSLPSQSAEGASTHLLQLSNLINTALNQIGEEVPQSPAPSLPVASTAFDVLLFSVELSERSQTFSSWSKRVLRHLQRKSRCPRH
ncbi:uncharacterized protein LOC111661210 [Seriola lalandi dorsalis]|uniref:Uncharacterized LOC111661210 n=1 Tax=Seriola lalandi dorsalis TaxID=1841481 RepID=A0A3B4XNS1_SERLL|nr:uncharacterized protein LOC111661210 [Seriola lalandi dorsalis]